MTNSKKQSRGRFVLCIENRTYPASLELRKVYRSIPDRTAESRGFIRIVDESGEDYLYPANYFVANEVPSAATKALAESSR
jgi:hypothetical protein